MEFLTFNQLPLYTDDFSFHALLSDSNERDAIVIHHPQDAICVSPVFLRSRKPLAEHIEYVQTHQLKKAIVIAEDIHFLTQCPSLEYLRIIPAISVQEFDFSPLYEMPCIRWLNCDTMYGPHDQRVSQIDYSKIHGLQCLYAREKEGHQRIDAINGLKILYLSYGQPQSKTLRGVFDGAALEKLVLCQSPVQSLDGIEKAVNLRILALENNRNLKDISALSAVKDTLTRLTIENCGRIQDFSVLSQLHHLDTLILDGSNTLPDLSCIHHMPNLEHLVVYMNVADGDLRMCKGIAHVAIKNRRHYNCKDQDFSKNFSNGAQWRQKASDTFILSSQ